MKSPVPKPMGQSRESSHVQHRTGRAARMGGRGRDVWSTERWQIELRGAVGLLPGMFPQGKNLPRRIFLKWYPSRESVWDSGLTGWALYRIGFGYLRIMCAAVRNGSANHHNWTRVIGLFWSLATDPPRSLRAAKRNLRPALHL